jgi:hypothetical protein
VVTLSFSQFLALYGWFALAVLLAFLLLIARFYQRFSGKRMYFSAYWIPLVCFGAAAIRYASIGSISGDPFAAVALLLGGITLLYLCGTLARYMLLTNVNQEQPDRQDHL